MLVSSSNPSLWCLANTGQWDRIEQDLELVDPDANDADCGKTIAWLAANSKKYPLLDKMIKCHPRLNINACPKSDPGKTIVWLLADDNRWDTVTAILQNPYMKPDVNAYPKSLTQKQTVVVMAASQKQLDLVKLLFSQFQIDTDAVVYNNRLYDSLFDTLCIHMTFPDEFLYLYTLHNKRVPPNFPDCSEVFLQDKVTDFFHSCERRIFVHLPHKCFLAHLPKDLQKLLFCFLAKAETSVYKDVSNHLLTSWIDPARIQAGLEQEKYRVAHPYTWWITTQVQWLFSEIFRD